MGIPTTSMSNIMGVPRVEPGGLFRSVLAIEEVPRLSLARLAVPRVEDKHSSGSSGS